MGKIKTPASRVHSNWHVWALVLSILTYPTVVPLVLGTSVSIYLDNLTGNIPVVILLSLVTPILAYAFLWGPLSFALAIALGKIHRRGRWNDYQYLGKSKATITDWPHVSIQVPIYTESWDIIEPTLIAALDAVNHYNSLSPLESARAHLVVSDDGLQLLCAGRLEEITGFVSEQARRAGVTTEIFAANVLADAEKQLGQLSREETEALKRLWFYERNSICCIARPGHDPGNYERRGEFKKASNLNETLRLGALFEEYSGDEDGSVEEKSWNETLKSPRWRGFFITSPPRLGDYILLLDKDSGTPRYILEHVIPTFLSDESIAYSVHPTKIRNATQNIITKLISPGATLYFNYWLPFLAQTGFLFFPGHNGVIRKQAIKQIGGWPETHVAEDYVASLRMRQEHNPITGQQYRGTYLNIEGEIFTEDVPSSYLSFLKMIMKYMSGSFQMFLNPVMDWAREGVFTQDIRSFLDNSNIPFKEKVTIFLGFIWYLSMVPLVMLTVFGLHFIPPDYVPTIFIIALSVLIATNMPFWAAKWRESHVSNERFGLDRLPATLPFRHIVSATIFHVGLSFYLFSAAVRRLFGEIRPFHATTLDRSKEKTSESEISAVFSVTGRIQIIALLHLLLVTAYLGLPDTKIGAFKYFVCIQWGLASFIAPLVFEVFTLSYLKRIDYRTYSPLTLMQVGMCRTKRILEGVDKGKIVSWFALSTIILIAAIVRFSGLDYNTPFIDETFYQIAGRRFLSEGIANYSYLTGAVYSWPVLATISESLWGVYAARGLAALIGIVSVSVAYATGKRLWGVWNGNSENEYAIMAGVLSAALLACSPTAVWISRIGTHDALGILFYSIAVYMIIRALSGVDRNYLSLAAIFLLGSVITSYSNVISAPWLMVFVIATAPDRTSRIKVVREFIVPFCFLLLAYASLTYPYSIDSILNASAQANNVPHQKFSSASVLREVAFRSPSTIMVIIIMAVGVLGYLRLPEKVKSTVKRKKLIAGQVIYGCVVLSVPIYYVVSGHGVSIDRKLAIVDALSAPMVGVFLLTLLARLKNSYQEALSFGIAGAALLSLYFYGSPIIKSNEKSFVNMDPVLEILHREILQNNVSPISIGYVSYENLLYLKQSLAKSGKGRITVDETGPWAGDWRDRISRGWRPDVLVGMLANRYQSLEEQRKEENVNLLTASEMGYR
ncbi:MAG: hypothetical protein FE835_18110 [Gammaproteobacteria bacterium]|nr:hypothetical protein [Gammaproteobacteria bacterium]